MLTREHSIVVYDGGKAIPDRLTRRTVIADEIDLSPVAGGEQQRLAHPGQGVEDGQSGRQFSLGEGEGLPH